MLTLCSFMSVMLNDGGGGGGGDQMVYTVKVYVVALNIVQKKGTRLKYLVILGLHFKESEVQAISYSKLNYYRDLPLAQQQLNHCTIRSNTPRGTCPRNQVRCRQ